MATKYIKYFHGFGALLMGIGAIALTETAANADIISQTAQTNPVVITAQVTPPTPLNLRPRVHIPLPTSNSDHYYRRDRRYHRTYDPYDRYDPDCKKHDRYDYDHHDRRSSHRDKVIIISPGNSNIYDRYHRSIRVITK